MVIMITPKKQPDALYKLLSILIMISLLFWSFDIEFTLKHYGAAFSILFCMKFAIRGFAKEDEL